MTLINIKVEYIVNELGENASADLFCGVFVGGDCGDTGTINDWTVIVIESHGICNNSLFD